MGISLWVAFSQKRLSSSFYMIRGKILLPLSVKFRLLNLSGNLEKQAKNASKLGLVMDSTCNALLYMQHKNDYSQSIILINLWGGCISLEQILHSEGFNVSMLECVTKSGVNTAHFRSATAELLSPFGLKLQRNECCSTRFLSDGTLLFQQY